MATISVDLDLEPLQGLIFKDTGFDLGGDGGIMEVLSRGLARRRSLAAGAQRQYRADYSACQYPLGTHYPQCFCHMAALSLLFFPE